MYYYNLNLREGNGSNWHGIKLIPYFYYRNTKLSMQEIRLFEHTNYVPVIKNGGWHLSYFGDETFIYNKLVNFKEMEKQHETACCNLNINDIIDKIKNGVNFLNNTELVYIPIEENHNLPYKYDEYLTNFYIGTPS
jgi:beta-1,4-mannosyl-glycoprotein beta-1,4-N-acetylglucosaminyltransferase